MLHLLETVEELLKEAGSSVPIYYVSPASGSVVAHANISMEWLNAKRQNRVYDAQVRAHLHANESTDERLLLCSGGEWRPTLWVSNTASPPGSTRCALRRMPESLFACFLRVFPSFVPLVFLSNLEACYCVCAPPTIGGHLGQRTSRNSPWSVL